MLVANSLELRITSGLQMCKCLLMISALKLLLSLLKYVFVHDFSVIDPVKNFWTLAQLLKICTGNWVISKSNLFFTLRFLILPLTQND